MFSSSDQSKAAFSIGFAILAITFGYMIVLYSFAYLFMQLF